MKEIESLQVYIDSTSRNPKTQEITIIGWALDPATGMVPAIKIAEADFLTSSSLTLVHRGDVNELFGLKPFVSCGFVIRLVTAAKEGNVMITFTGEQEEETKVMDLNQHFANPNAGRLKAKVRTIYHKIRKGLSYLKRNGVRNTWRRLRIEQVRDADRYQEWIATHETTDYTAANRELKQFTYYPLISIVMPVYNVDHKWLEQCVQSVLAQIYPNWELCICDDASTDPELPAILQAYAQQDQRIKVAFREKNGHICQATNTAIELTQGEFIAFLDDDDELAPNALFEVVKVLNQQPDADLIYSDEDKIDEQGQRLEPAFKPQWSPDLLLSTNYISHLSVIRASIVKQLGGLRVGFEGAQDYDLLLRVTECTTPAQIIRIPKVLYHWRMLKTSTASNQQAKKYAYEAGRKALVEALARRNLPGTVVIGAANGFYDVHYTIQTPDLVSIIIPTRNGYQDVKRCVDSIIELSSYQNYEILIADNGSDDPKMEQLYEDYRMQLGDRFIVESIDIPFHYARINNLAAKAAKGKYLLLLNNDTKVITPDWLEQMVAFAQFERIGAVGAKLYYPNKTIQHAGVILGLGGLAGHGHHTFPMGDFGYFGRLIENVNYLAVTAACLMIKKSDFMQLNGFDEQLAIAYNDVDLCLRCHTELGKDNVWLHGVELFHYESQSRGYENTPEKQQRFLREADYFSDKWPEFIAEDPYYSPNLTKQRGDFSIGE